MPKRKNPNALTVKEINFIKGLVAGKSQTQAALEATGATTPNSANVNAQRMLRKDTVQQALEKAMTKAGITMDDAIAPIKKGLHAKKAEVTDEGVEVVDDLDLQLKASDRALKLMGVGKEQKVGGGVHFHQHVSEQLTKYVKAEQGDD